MTEISEPTHSIFIFEIPLKSSLANYFVYVFVSLSLVEIFGIVSSLKTNYYGNLFKSTFVYVNAASIIDC